MISSSSPLSSEICKHLASRKTHLDRLCDRVADLQEVKALTRIQNPLECAKREALYKPKPVGVLAPLSQSAWLQIADRSGFAGRIVRYAIATITWSYQINLDAPPNNQWAAQGQIAFIRGMVSDGIALSVAYRAIFATTRKAALVAGGLFFLFSLGIYFYQRMKIGEPQFNPNQFTDFTRKAREGKFSYSIAREKELHALVAALAGESPATPMLLGRSGVGKTQLVEGLANAIAEGKIPALSGMRVLAVNMSTLLGIGGWDGGSYASRIEMLFAGLKGYEDRVILFFDEVHNAAAKQKDSGTVLLEELKTKLLQTPVRCVLATTEEEYRRDIAPNTAFVRRIAPIEILEMKREDVLFALQTYFASSSIQIVPEVYRLVIDEIAKRSQFSDFGEPSKSKKILQELLGFVRIWRPQKIEREKEAKRRELTALQAEAQRESAAGREAGESTIQGIERLNGQIAELEEREKSQDELCGRIRFYQEQIEAYQQAECAVVHELKERGDAMRPAARKAVEKRYLLLKVIVREVRSALETACERMKTEYKERVPLAVDVDVVRTIYPEVKA